MKAEKFLLSPPSLEEIAEALRAPLAANYEHSSISVERCPDLREPPFHLATKGLSGDEKISDVGGQANLFPAPRLENRWSMEDIATAMEMDLEVGSLFGAGAGPFYEVGRNCELAPNFSWSGDSEKINNQTRVAQIKDEDNLPTVEKSSSLNCALMINLFGSLGQTGPVLKIVARKRKGSHNSFTECIQTALQTAYGDTRPISLGGAFLIKSGKTYWHIMPDFPAEQDLPFKSRQQLGKWLTYHEFDSPMIGLSVLHSADPGQKMDLRMEHTHGYSPTGQNAGGHYHYDLDGEDVEYEGYFNTAKAIYRIERPGERSK
ncbi:hypothetical protein ACN47E_007541 [Coniothyrium glycines]